MSTPNTDYTQFRCPNPVCIFYNTPDQANIMHRSWTGTNKNIERLRCTACKKEFSDRCGTLQERAKIPLEKQELMLKCFRWGVCEEGTADISNVNPKTVRLFQEKTAKRAETHHDNLVKDVRTPGVQLDELWAKMAGQKQWLAAAIAMKSLLIIAVTIGNRDGKLADRLLAQVWARCSWIGIFLTDGWRPYLTSIIKCFGALYQPRKKSQKGRKKRKRIKLPVDTLYAQVVKVTNNVFSLVGVKCRAMIGKLQVCELFIRAYGLGNKIHTIHIERWFGTLRSNLACLRRRSRCPVKTINSIENKVWVFVSLYNWVICHSSLTKNQIKRTPAMAAGLIDHPLSYREYILLQVFPCGDIAKRVEDKLQIMSSDEYVKATKRYEVNSEERIVWESPPLNKEAVA
jgi:IS1 family transposase